jgi:hypothetical protein
LYQVKIILILALWLWADFGLALLLHHIGFWYDDNGHQGGPTS